jgi:Fic family protein
MKISDFKSSKSGQLVRTEGSNWAFLPDLLPPEVTPSSELFRLTSEADAELGRLCGLIDQMSDPETLFMNFMRREAILSSRIEGTHSTIARVALVQASNAKAGSRDDIEVNNYVEAMKLGMKRCVEIKLGTTFIRELHARLLRDATRTGVTAGKERAHQVLVGGDGSYSTARYVPPPPQNVAPLMENLEAFLQDESLPVLIRAAIAHYQFEAIHPFDDGNGRVGRILISTLLGKAGRLNAPVLYLSAYFERYKLQYYDHLLAVSQKGAWEDWFIFFLRGVKEQARDGAVRADRLHKLRQYYYDMLSTPRTSATMGRLIDALFRVPVTTVPWAAIDMGVSHKPAKESIKKLVAKGVLERSIKIGNLQCYSASGIDAVLDIPTEDVLDAGHQAGS